MPGDLGVADRGALTRPFLDGLAGIFDGTLSIRHVRNRSRKSTGSAIDLASGAKPETP
jgi:hypothetical protein